MLKNWAVKVQPIEIYHAIVSEQTTFVLPVMDWN